MKNNKYADIIDLPHHVSKKHPHMSMHDRAAQFSPFAALTGHDAAVKETARITSDRIELDESEKILINEKLKQLQSVLNETVVPNTELQQRTDDILVAEFTYYQPDLLKEGGEYVSKQGIVKRIDMYRRVIVLSDAVEIQESNICTTGREAKDMVNIIEINIDDIIKIKI